MDLANYPVFTETMAILDLLLDIAIFCLPLPVIKNLQIYRKRKLSLIGMFALGLMYVHDLCNQEIPR